jgi:hypothetical protein
MTGPRVELKLAGIADVLVEGERVVLVGADVDVASVPS